MGPKKKKRRKNFFFLSFLFLLCPFHHHPQKNEKKRVCFSIYINQKEGMWAYYYCVIFVVVCIAVLYYRSVKLSPFVLPRDTNEDERLGELIRRGDLLVQHVREQSYPSKNIADRIIKNWEILRREKRIGITPHDTDTPGFVVNKHDAMQICVTKDPAVVGDIDDLNAATFVMIHEIAHLGAIEYEHGQEFVSVFQKLLRASINIGIWKYVDYAKEPQTYCQYNINATPTVPSTFTAKFG
jgi:hypothetical protein